MFTENHKATIRILREKSMTLPQILETMTGDREDITRYFNTLHVMASESFIFLIIQPKGWIIVVGDEFTLQHLKLRYGADCKYLNLGLADPKVPDGILATDLRFELSLISLLTAL